MADPQEHQDPPPPAMMKKGCQISLMWPIKADDEALDVKKAIDTIVADIKEKRYTFQITEM